MGWFPPAFLFTYSKCEHGTSWFTANGLKWFGTVTRHDSWFKSNTHKGHRNEGEIGEKQW